MTIRILEGDGMDAKSSFISRHKGFVMAALVLVIICGCIVQLLYNTSAPAAGQSIALSPEATGDAAGWQAFTIEGEDGASRKVLQYDAASGMYTGLDYPGQVVYMEQQLTQIISDESQPVLIIDAPDTWLSIWVDGQLLYTDVPGSSAEIGRVEFPDANPRAVSREIHVSLPADYLDKTLTIGCSIPAKVAGEYGYGQTTRPPTINMASTQTKKSEAIAESFPLFYPYTLLLYIGVILTGLALLQIYLRQMPVGMLLLALFAFLLALDQAAQLPATLNYQQAYTIPFYVRLYTTELALLPLLLFIATRLKRFRVLMLLVSFLYAAYQVLAATAMNIWGIQMPSTYIMPMQLPALAISLAIIRLEWGKAPLARLAGWTAALLAVCCVVIQVGTIVLVHNEVFMRFNLIITTAIGYAQLGMMSICAIWVVRDMLRTTAERNADMEIIDARNDMAQQSYHNMMGTNKQIAEMHGDIRACLSRLDDFIEKGEYGSARDYLAELILREQETIQMVHTDNDLVNTIFNGKIAQAMRLGVTVNTHIDVPFEVDVPEADMVSIFMNLLDNAIHACEGIADRSGRWVEWTVQPKGEMLHIHMINPLPDGGLAGPSEDALKEHGYGLRVVCDAAERNRGGITAAAKDGVFEVEGSIYIGRPAVSIDIQPVDVEMVL